MPQIHKKTEPDEGSVLDFSVTKFKETIIHSQIFHHYSHELHTSSFAFMEKF